MNLEAIVTTVSKDDSVNVAPMGPHFNHSPDEPVVESFELRPFTTSQTFKNLQATGCGVLHVTDDVLLFARAAIHNFTEPPETTPAKHVEGAILAECCRWYEFKTKFIETTGDRASIQCKIIGGGRQRDFFGFNRAKHAVIEAAILATRIDFIPIDAIREQLNPLRSIVDKTGGVDEKTAFGLLEQFIIRPNHKREESKVDNER